eukprot:scaffold4980_cov23-Tisochrysis_lutea.AAC.4
MHQCTLTCACVPAGWLASRGDGCRSEWGTSHASYRRVCGAESKVRRRSGGIVSGAHPRSSIAWGLGAGARELACVLCTVLRDDEAVAMLEERIPAAAGLHGGLGQVCVGAG